VPRFLPTFIDGPRLSSLHSGAENHVVLTLQFSVTDHFLARPRLI
jgi:hypothetical protein